MWIKLFLIDEIGSIRILGWLISTGSPLRLPQIDISATSEDQCVDSLRFGYGHL